RFEPGDRGWGWTAAFFDYENDGDDDMYLTNGWIEGSSASNQKNQMFINDNAFFYVASDKLPEAFPGNSRGAIVFDMDKDGDMDIAVNNFRQPFVLLENTQAMGNKWIGVRLKGAGPNANGVGARLTVKAGDKKITKEVTCGNMYLGQDEDVVTIGIGQAADAEVNVRWPGGKTSTAKVEAGKIAEIKL